MFWAPGRLRTQEPHKTLSGLVMWAGILYHSISYLNQGASDKTGLWPVAHNTDKENGKMEMEMDR
jgi:hypothetical protein